MGQFYFTVLVYVIKKFKNIYKKILTYKKLFRPLFCRLQTTTYEYDTT